MKAFLTSLAALLLSGCVMIDSRVSETKPAAVDLPAFAGTYAPTASYSSKYWTGLREPNELATFLNLTPALGPIKPDAIRLSFTPQRALVIEALAAGAVQARRELVEKTDFDFASGVITLHRESSAGGHDSPGIGVMTNTIRLQLDATGNLVVIRGSAAAGFATIIPVAMTGKGMAIFPRQ